MKHLEKILIVEDDEGVAFLQRQRLERIGYRVVMASNCDEALEQAKQGVDVIVLDYCLGNVTGLDVYQKLKASGLDLPVVMVTGFSEEATVIQALRLGVRDFVAKNSQYLDYLPQAVDRVLQQVRTEKQLAASEARLRQGQKMEALGKLAGGVAHEFNNLLQIIHGFTECVVDRNEDLETKEDLKEVLKATARASVLTRQLLAFGRRQPMQKESLDLRDMTRDLIKMLRPLIGKHIQVKVVIDEGLGFVSGDMTMIGQAIMNLCLNARDAMEKGGLLTIECDNISLDESVRRSHNNVPPGDYVRLRITDTGTGIPNEHLPHLFEPFFTTKPVGKGTGLGLPTVFGIIEEHEGVIEVASTFGEGTAFTIYLPRIEQAPGLDATVPRVTAGGAETILVAEDEPAIRNFLARVLSRAGYQVITACDGEEAVQVFQEFQDQISLVLLDMVMPKQVGRVAYEAIQTIKPNVKAAFISRYDPQAGQFDFASIRDVQILQKPILRSDLLQAVRGLLDAPVLLPVDLTQPYIDGNPQLS